MTPIIYCDELAYDCNVDLPSLRKSVAFVQEVLKLEPMTRLLKPRKVWLNELAWTHDQNFLSHVMRSPGENNGIQIVDDEVGAWLVQRAYWAVSSMVMAAELALDCRVACAPVSGFHHAGFDFNSGYCTFNGIMVAIMKLFKDGKIKKAAIVDLDAHYGDGTQDIINQLGLRGHVMHLTHGQTHSFAKFTRSADQTLRALAQHLEELLVNFKADLVIYQAGADIHVHDPLGAGYMTTSQMEKRDFLVFDACRRAKVPVAWNLAGGYQGLKEVVQLHLNTWHQCQKVFNPPALEVVAPAA